MVFDLRFFEGIVDSYLMNPIEVLLYKSTCVS